MTRSSSRLNLVAALSLFATLAPAAHAQLFVAHDSDNVYQIDSSGTQSTYAPGVTGQQGYLNGITFDVGGNLYAVDANHYTINKITPGGVKSTFATFSTTNNYPYADVFDSHGNLLVTNGEYHGGIFKVDSNGNVATFASGGMLNSSAFGLAIDSTGNVYTSLFNGNVIKITPDGSTQTLFANVGSPVQQIAFDSIGNLYAAGYTGTDVYKITPGGTVSTFASGFTGGPQALAFDPNGNLYVGDARDNNIYKVDSSGNSTLFTTITSNVSSGSEFFAYRTPAASAVPEPGSVALLVGLGVTGAGFLVRKRRAPAC